MDWSLPPVPPRPARRPEDAPWSPRTVVVGLLAVAVVASALAGPWRATPSDPTGTVRRTPLEHPPPPAPAERDPLLEALRHLTRADVDLGWVWGVAAALVLLGVGLVVLHMLRARRREGAEAPPVPGDPGGAVVPLEVHPLAVGLRHGVDDAVTRLGSEPAPADAIVAAWVSLEEAAERSGVHRNPADTPTEFTVAVLDRAHVDPGATRTLLDLYLRARFSDEALSPDAVVAARKALDVVATDLDRPSREATP